MGSKPQPAREQHRRVARAYFREGKSLPEAMKAGDFSSRTGEKGITNLVANSHPFAEAFNEELEFALKSAKSLKLPPEDFTKLVEWRLAINIARGRDDGAQSTKLAGQLKKLDIFVRHADGGGGLFLGLISDPASEAITKEVLEALNRKPADKETLR